MTPTATVIVPALDAADTIADQLEALLTQEGARPDAIVVVDDASSDSTPTIVRDFQAAHSAVRLVVGSTNRGPGWARNRGAEIASTEVLAFCDDDDIVGPRWLAAHLAALDAGHDASYGPIAEFRDVVPSFDGEWCHRELTIVAPYRLLPSGNLAIRRDAFRAVGGFATDPRLSEDMDLSVRLQRAGFTVGYAPEAKLAWRRPRGFWSEIGKQRRYMVRYHRTLLVLGGDVVGERHGPLSRRAAWLVRQIPVLARSDRDRQEWARVAGRVVGDIEWQFRRRLGKAPV